MDNQEALKAVTASDIAEAFQKLGEALNDFVDKVQKFAEKVVQKLKESLDNILDDKVKKAYSLYKKYGNPKYLNFIFRHLRKKLDLPPSTKSGGK